jgi:hypothetical protein
MWGEPRRILSPLRLPVPPLRQFHISYIIDETNYTGNLFTFQAFSFTNLSHAHLGAHQPLFPLFPTRSQYAILFKRNFFRRE